jgi:hypothetical protein
MCTGGYDALTHPINFRATYLALIIIIIVRALALSIDFFVER